MNTRNKYDPEDIESLLLNKKFDELYEEEAERILDEALKLAKAAKKDEMLRNYLKKL